jgi:heptosyltransferase-2
MSTRLVALAPNWLGDAVMALPALADVAAAASTMSLDVAARSSIAPLFGMMPGVAGTIVLPGGPASVRALAGGRYDAAILLPNSFHTARLAHRAAIPERWGYRADFRSWLLTRGVARPDRVHQSEFYRHLVLALGYTPTPARTLLQVDAEGRSAGRHLLEREGWDGSAHLVAVAPGAAFGGAKRWPAASFTSVIDGLARDGVRAVVVGSAGDAGAAREVVTPAHDARPINLVGRTDLPMLAAVLVQCRALVTNDSGAMHFASALGVPVTAMFGPTRDRETHPSGPGPHVVLTHPVWCRPCMLRECPLTKRCMTGIGVEQVLGATRTFLDPQGTSRT